MRFRYAFNRRYLRSILSCIIFTVSTIFLWDFYRYSSKVDVNLPVLNKYIGNNEQVVVNVGVVRCFKLLHKKWCPTVIGSTNTGSKFSKRTIIEKDLDFYASSYNPIKNYLFFDAVSKDTFVKHEKLEYIHDIISKPEDTKTNNNSRKYKKIVGSMYASVVKHVDIKDLDAVNDINVFYNLEQDPRRNWRIVEDIKLNELTRISLFKAKPLADKVSSINVEDRMLRVKPNTSKYKIVQLADLHFSIEDGVCRDEFPNVDPNCKADVKTTTFINQVLNIEKPDLVIFTGDQIMGDLCKKDSESALLKVVAPVISRGIQWAMVWGNHDDEGSLSRFELSKLASSLPYSVFRINAGIDTADNNFGVGNYVQKIYQKEPFISESYIPIVSLIFLDSHKYSKQGKIYPGYDWIKKTQYEYIGKHFGVKTPLNLAFFHIPVPEYINPIVMKSNDNKKLVGSVKEGITAPRFNSGTLQYLKERLNVQMVSVGHDHCNDYCLLDDSNGKNSWLCYGGGAGEGGYSGYGGTERRIRMFEIDTTDQSVHTWKRLHSSPDKKFDEQVLVQNSQAV